MDDSFLLTLSNAAAAGGGPSFTLDGPYPFHYTIDPGAFPDVRTLAPGDSTDKLAFLLNEANHVQSDVSYNSEYANKPALLRPIVVRDDSSGAVGQLLLLVFLRRAAPAAGATSFANADIEGVVIVGAADRVAIGGRPLKTLAGSVTLAASSGVASTCSQTTLAFCTQLHITAVPGVDAADAPAMLWQPGAASPALTFTFTDNPAPPPAPAPAPTPSSNGLAIALGVLAGALLLGVLAYFGWRWWQRRRMLRAWQASWLAAQAQSQSQSQSQSQDQPQSQPGPAPPPTVSTATPPAPASPAAAPAPAPASGSTP